MVQKDEIDAWCCRENVEKSVKSVNILFEDTILAYNYSSFEIHRPVIYFNINRFCAE